MDVDIVSSEVEDDKSKEEVIDLEVRTLQRHFVSAIKLFGKWKFMDGVLFDLLVFKGVAKKNQFALTLDQE